MAKMNEETQAVYAKYGVNPMGSCVQMIIQIPILFALYRVIWNIPAYVDKVKAVFAGLTTSLLNTAGAEEFLSEASKKLTVSFKTFNENTIIDVLYKFKPDNWDGLFGKFPALSDQITSTRTNVDRMNTFLGGLNIADSPMNIIRTAWTNKAIILLIAAVMIPLLAALTQWLNAKLMTTGTQQANGKEEAANDQMSQTMKSMNTMMPIMSAVFCLSLPVGMGIYWIAGAVVRSIQQVVINRHLDKIDIDELAKKNLEKLNAKRAKNGLPPEKMNSNAHISTRNIETSNYGVSASKRAELQKRASEVASKPSSGTSNAKPGSLAAKANMVKDYNEKHGRK
jgi:YidC/Oxa1 family membrane protein insertase